MVNLAKGDAFRERSFITTERRIGGILFSPDADLMILETMEPLPLSNDSLQPTSAISSDEQRIRMETPVQVNFFRLIKPGGDEVDLKEGSAFRARVPGRIPANSAGYVATVDQGQQHWAFDFHTYSGKVKELSQFNSTCRPVPMLVSRGEFIAFGCGLNHSPQVIGGFNMRGEEMWQQTLPESYIAPTFAFAPRAGRFVMSRLLTHSSVVQTSDILMPELVAGQTIVVYQTDSGRQILRVDAAPVSRAGQNFALAPDGMTLAVIRTDAVEVYALPTLTPRERDAVKLAESSAPQEDNTPPGLFDSPIPRSDAASSAAAAAAFRDQKPPELKQVEPPASQAPQSAVPADTPTSSPTESQQAPTEATPRKPPTLYSPGQEAKPEAPKQ